MKNKILLICVLCMTSFCHAQEKKDSSQVKFGFLLDGLFTNFPRQQVRIIPLVEPTVFMQYKKWRIGLGYQFGINTKSIFTPVMPILKTCYNLKNLGKNGVLGLNMNLAYYLFNRSLTAGKGDNGVNYVGTIKEHLSLLSIEPGISYRLNMKKHFFWESCLSVPVFSIFGHSTYTFPTNPTLDHTDRIHGIAPGVYLRTGFGFRF
jgi:hypothetical protein